jgi:serine/threonine protein kinase
VAADRLEEGKILGGRLLLKRKIGYGGFGEVWLAEDRSASGRLVAAKVVHEYHLQTKRILDRFQREADVLLTLDHPNIARAYAFEIAPRPYIIMELVDGPSLEHDIGIRAKNGRNYELSEIASLVKQLGSALEHAHRRGVVHRDLKPGNVLLARGTDGSMVPKVLDFGLAKIATSTGDQTTVGRMLGSFLYMSPEQVRGQSVTPGSDLFAFGTILFELITLRVLFARDARNQPVPATDSQINDGEAAEMHGDLVRRILIDPRPMPSTFRREVSPGLDRALDRALDPDPSARFANVDDMVRAVLTGLAERTASPTRPALARAETAAAPDTLQSVDEPKTLDRMERPTLDTLDSPDVRPTLEATDKPAYVDARITDETRAQNLLKTESDARESPTLRPDALRKLAGKMPVVLPSSTMDTIEHRLTTTAVKAKDTGANKQRLRLGLAMAGAVMLMTAAITARLFMPVDDDQFVRVQVPPLQTATVSASPHVEPHEAVEPPEKAEPKARVESGSEVAPPPHSRTPSGKRRPAPVEPETKASPPADRYADLKRLLADLEANPNDPNRADALTKRIQAAADELSDRARRTAVKRCVTVSGTTELSECVRMLTR